MLLFKGIVANLIMILVHNLMSHDILQPQGWTIPHEPYGSTDFKSVASLNLIFSYKLGLYLHISVLRLVSTPFSLARYYQLSKNKLDLRFSQSATSSMLIQLIPNLKDYPTIWEADIYQFRHRAILRYFISNRKKVQNIYI